MKYFAAIINPYTALPQEPKTSTENRIYSILAILEALDLILKASMVDG
ncbi:hypothetical protein QG37_00114 [Candidozyma auris]|nr:hypothetical protein QG37_00114 [[Candida] auris]